MDYCLIRLLDIHSTWEDWIRRLAATATCSAQNDGNWQSNWSRADVITRTTAMNMMSVPIWEEADAMKKKYKIWTWGIKGFDRAQIK